MKVNVEIQKYDEKGILVTTVVMNVAKVVAKFPHTSTEVNDWSVLQGGEPTRADTKNH